MNEFGLSENAISIFKSLYCLAGESINDAFKRVAREFATNDDEYNMAYDLLTKGLWRPNTPVWLNAGNEKGKKIFSACWVVDIEDSMDGIYDIANVCRKVFQFGAGIGLPIGSLREKDSPIYEGREDKEPNGKSSGPVTFMKLYNTVGETTKSGGRVRRAAILCAMPINHPDVLDFITCKTTDGELANMNISVGITDEFMKALEDGVTYQLISPNKAKRLRDIDAKEVWDKFVYSAWKTADPGVLFLDVINRDNPLSEDFPIKTTNPCLPGDVLITTKDGVKRIDEINLGDEVYTYNHDNGKIELEQVTFSSKTRENADVIKIELDDGTELELTPDHKVYTKNRGYVNASNISYDDIIVRIEKE